MTAGPLLDCGLFNQSVLKSLLDQHESGSRDHSTPIWTLLMFDAVLRTALEAQRPQLVAAA